MSSPAGDHHQQQLTPPQSRAPHPPPWQQQQQHAQSSAPAALQPPTLHLQVPAGPGASFPSPSLSPSSALSEHGFAPWYAQPSPSPIEPSPQHAPLSLNLSGLSVQPGPPSSAQRSPLDHAASSSASTASPVTPLSARGGHGGGSGGGGGHAHHASFGFAPPELVRFEDPYEVAVSRARALSHEDVKSGLPRKRSFEEGIGADNGYDDVDMGYALGDESPMEGDGSADGDDLKLVDGPIAPAPNAHNVGRPAGSNNFVAKLYQCVPFPR
jgi:hypothetical protein